MITFAIDVDASQLNAQLTRLLEALGPKVMRRFLTRTGKLVARSVKMNFAKGGRPKWRWLDPDTYTRRTRKRSGRGSRRSFSTTPLGGRHGTFAKSITVKLVESNTAVLIAPPSGLRELVEIHAKGKGHNPRRDAYVLQQKDVDKIVEVLGKVVDRALGLTRRGRSGARSSSRGFSMRGGRLGSRSAA